MKFQLKRIRASSMALAILSGALLQPLAIAQTQMKPGSEAMDMKGMDMKGMMKDNHDKMSATKMSGNVDVDFATMMRIHHLGAIDMAQAELRDGKDPQMREMAKRIIAAQKKEIATFDKFLAKPSQPAEKMAK